MTATTQTDTHGTPMRIFDLAQVLSLAAIAVVVWDAVLLFRQLL